MAPDKGCMLCPCCGRGCAFGRAERPAANLLLAVPVAFFTTQYHAGLTSGQIASGEYMFVMQRRPAVAALVALIPAIVLGERRRAEEELQRSLARLQELSRRLIEVEEDRAPQHQPRAARSRRAEPLRPQPESQPGALAAPRRDAAPAVGARSSTPEAARGVGAAGPRRHGGTAPARPRRLRAARRAAHPCRRPVETPRRAGRRHRPRSPSRGSRRRPKRRCSASRRKRSTTSRSTRAPRTCEIRSRGERHGGAERHRRRRRVRHRPRRRSARRGACTTMRERAEAVGARCGSTAAAHRPRGTARRRSNGRRDANDDTRADRRRSRPAARRPEALLQATGDITVVGEVGNGQEALRRVPELEPGRRADGHRHAGAERHRGDARAGAEVPRHARHHRLHARHLRARPPGARGRRRGLSAEGVGRKRGRHRRARRARRQPLSVARRRRVRTGGPRARRASPLERLSARERQVLQLVAEGKSSAEIARIVHLSPKTVETYRSRLMKKLGVGDIPALVRLAIQHGITPPG